MFLYLRYFSVKANNLRPNKANLSKTFDDLFRNNQNQKVSKEGSFDALYQECMSDIYKRRAEADDYTDETKESPEIAELTAKELHITRSIFKRVDPLKKFVPRLENKDDYIDPYWDPFQKIDNLKIQLASEFNDLARLVSSAEARKYRMMIRETLQQHDKYCNSYFDDKGDDTEVIPRDLHERFWDPDVDKRLVLRNNLRPFCWRDLHVLHNFVAENGQILPRRLTYATRKQQRQIFKAIKIARQMALFPYDWKPRYRDRIPLMDPRQYLADELYHRYSKLGDLRAKAIINVMMKRYPDVNNFRYLRYESQKYNRYLKTRDDSTFATLLNEHKKHNDTI